jgi:acyl-CoA reductase-like NAD-dependent aldehyde dehydrogenase
MADPISRYWRNFIDGEFVDGGAGRIEVDDPATGEILAEQALADARDVDRAVSAARALPRQRRAVGAQTGRARPHGPRDGRLSACAD